MYDRWLHSSSKSLLRIANTRHTFRNVDDIGLIGGVQPSPNDPFARIAEHLNFTSNKKTTKMFEKVDLKLCEGSASFIDPYGENLIIESQEEGNPLLLTARGLLSEHRLWVSISLLVEYAQRSSLLEVLPQKTFPR